MKQISQSKTQQTFIYILFRFKKSLIRKLTSTKKISQAIFQPVLLLCLLLNIPSISLAAPGNGIQLLDNLVGTYGEATEVMKTEITQRLEESGIEKAALEAQTVLAELAEGAVPVIDKLKDPYQDKAEEAIAQALTKAQLATKILNKITQDGSQKAIEFITNSPLFADADFGITTPTGRIRLYRQGTEASLCRTITGPLGSVIIMGISNAEKLCHFNDPRMGNPTKSLLAFTYIAAGRTHIRTNRILLPNLAEDLTRLPAPINAETYVSINDQWVQITLAGSDPKSLEVEAKLEVGLKGGVSYYVEAEVEGEAAIKIKLKPVYAAEVIRGASEAMLNQATALNLDMKIGNVPSDAAIIMKAGLDYLGNVEGQYEDGFGEASIEVKLTGGIGAGMWDTGIAGVSVNRSLELKYPLDAMVATTSGTLERYLDIALGMNDAGKNLATAILENNSAAGIETFKQDARAASSTFVNGVLIDLLAITTNIEFASSFKLALLGDADKQSIDLYKSEIKIPIGNVSTTLQENPNAIADAGSAASYLMLAAINPDAVIDETVWSDLSLNLIPGIKYSLYAINPYTFKLVGIKDIELLDTLSWMTQHLQSIRKVLLSVIQSADENSLAALRIAIEEAVTLYGDIAIEILNKTTLSFSREVAASGALGAEVVAELGVGIKLESEIKTSLILLVLGLPEYQADDKDVLSKTSVPIELSLDIGASLAEGVELTVDAGGTLTMNLFELKALHWDGPLPTPALMKVAGFSVLEFDGTVNSDESLSGTGYLMLPMGGIVSAEFELDSNGNVITGSWSGGIELGPLGKFSGLNGDLNNDGLNGTIDVGLLGSEFNANFILNSSGFLLGSYDGSITIGGHQLAAANIYLGTDGQFYGYYEGDITIGGFTADSNLDFNNDGFSGSSYLNILGSELVSTDVVITRSGSISGTFTGNIVIGPHTLSAVSLQTVNGGLIGSAMMDLPGLTGAQVELRIFDGKVNAFYQGDLFNGLISQASFEISDSGVVMNANFNTSQFPNINNQVLNLVVDAAGLAQDQLQQARDDLEAAQSDLDAAEQALNNASAQLTAVLEAAQQKVLDATANTQEALQDLNVVIARIDELNNTYKSLIDDALKIRDAAQATYNSANSLVSYYNKKINDLSNWYNNLSTYNKSWYLAYYTKERSKLLALRTSAIAQRTAAKVTLDAAQLSYNVLTSELADLLNPFEISRNTLQATYNIADGLLTTAEEELQQIEASIIADTTLQPLYVTLDLTRATLKTAQELVDRLSGTIAMAEYFAAEGAEGAFSVLTANVTTDLTAMSGSFEIDARVIYLGQQGQITLMFDPADPINSFHQIVNSLQTGNALLSNSDIIPPRITANHPAEWTSNQTLIQLLADDNIGGTGIASITFSTTGAQITSEVTIAGKEAYVLINSEGLTEISFFTTDISGNVSETTTINASLDNSAPQISVTSSGINEGVYEVIINAKDLLGSGIAYLAVSASGAEYFTENIVPSDIKTISLTKKGITTLVITAVDVAGNSTLLTHEVNVPDITAIIDDSEPASDDTGGGGSGSPGLLWLVMVIGVLRLRRLPMQPK